MKTNNLTTTKGGVTLPQELIEDYAKKIFTPLFAGQCVSCIFAPGGGKRTIIKYLTRNETLIKKFFPHTFSKTLFVFVDFDEIVEFSNIEYLRLIKRKIFSGLEKRKIFLLDKEKINEDDAIGTIEKVLSLLVSKGWRVFFVLNDFELTLSLSSSIYLNLEHFLTVDKSKIEYLFLTTLNLLDPETISRFHNLKYALNRNIIFFPLFSKELSFYALDNMAKTQLNMKELSETAKEVLYELCGGHPQLLRYTLYYLREKFPEDIFTKREEIKKTVFSWYRCRSICYDIFSFFGKKEKSLLSAIVREEGVDLFENNPAFDYLLNLNLVIKSQNKLKVFGKVFEKFILEMDGKKTLFYDEKRKKIFYGTQSCENKFTFQEFKVIRHLLLHQNELVTRDEIAKAMWGSIYYQEKYSDWAIDKIISVIRKKLQKIGFPQANLETIKKRGFILKNEGE